MGPIGRVSGFGSRVGVGIARVASIVGAYGERSLLVGMAAKAVWVAATWGVVRESEGVGGRVWGFRHSRLCPHRLRLPCRRRQWRASR